MGGDGERKIVSEFDLGEKNVKRVAGSHSKARKDLFRPTKACCRNRARKSVVSGMSRKCSEMLNGQRESVHSYVRDRTNIPEARTWPSVSSCPGPFVRGPFDRLSFRAYGGKVLVVVAEVRKRERWIITGYWATPSGIFGCIQTARQ
jgi:hypothetical protein